MIAPSLYGLIVGIAIVVAISLIERQYKKLNYHEDCFWKIGASSLFFGIVGARLWHVATDFYLYRNNLIEVFFIWNGGISILGGVLGGVAGLYLALKYAKNCKIKFFEMLDIAVFGLPVAQAIGRLGNYVNQELYGKPSGDSIFSIIKIYISPENRLQGYESVEYYHPLFFYEMILMLAFGFAIYYLNGKNKLPKIGAGRLFLTYVLYYSVVRFFLDFIRLDKIAVVGDCIGTNQVVLFFVISFLSYLFFRKRKYE